MILQRELDLIVVPVLYLPNILISSRFQVIRADQTYPHAPYHQYPAGHKFDQSHDSLPKLLTNSNSHAGNTAPFLVSDIGSWMDAFDSLVLGCRIESGGDGMIREYY